MNMLDRHATKRILDDIAEARELLREIHGVGDRVFAASARGLLTKAYDRLLYAALSDVAVEPIAAPDAMAAE